MHFKLASQIERMYIKTFICRSVTHSQNRNDVLSFGFSVSQSYDNKSASLTDVASQSLIKIAHRVISNVYQVLSWRISFQ